MVNSPPGQVKVSSSHPINTLSGQVRVTPHKSEGIEPFTLVNSLPGKVGAAPSHLINTPLGPHKVATSVSSRVPVSLSPSVAPVLPLMSSTSVLVLITDRSLPVTSPLCPLPSDSCSISLKTMQATSHEQPVDLPVGLDCP